MPTTPRNYTLGLDLGVSSLGWAMIELDPKQRPKRILNAGVRIFEAGVEGDVEQGKDSSRAVQRREARQPRRVGNPARTLHAEYETTHHDNISQWNASPSSISSPGREG